MKPIAPALLAITLVACTGEPAPVPAQSPGANAPINAARATVDGIAIEARLIDIASLPPAMVLRYGIRKADDRWLLLITLRDGDGNGVPADSLRIEARAGGLAQALVPVPLRAIGIDGLVDLIGTVPAKPPETVRVEIDAVRGGARAEMRFSRDLPKP